MSLLQISEPGNSTLPNQKKLAIGIDLGTTNSLVAAYKTNQPETLADEKGRVILPSVVRYLDNEIVVGQAAKDQAVIDPLNTISSVKRLMGRGVGDVKQLGKQLPYDFVATQGMPKIKTIAGDVSPVQVSSEILKVLKRRAEEAFSDQVAGAVITVPAYFDDAQRQATKDAAKFAGINVLRLLNEPTAAAVAYGLDQGEEGIHAVYDLGGGTFDISILNLHHGVYEVMATGGNSALGGDDIDHVLAQWIKANVGLSDELSHGQSRALLTLARVIKEELTFNDKVPVEFLHWEGELTRVEFEALIAPLIEETLVACHQALKDANITAADVKAVALVGGATRTPYVRQQITTLFGKEPLCNIDPDQVVAIGAAIQAEVLIGNKAGDEMLLLDVLPLSLGLETVGGLAEKIIERNTTIPVVRAQEFTTYKDGQTGMVIHVVQGERELVNDCRSLAQFELRGIPPMKAGAARIQVEFQVDADGLLSVSAQEKSTGIETNVQVKPSYGLSDDEIADMLKASFTYAEADVSLRALTEEQVGARQLLELLQAALNEDGDKYLSAAEKNELEGKMAELIKVKEGTDRHAVHDAVKALDDASQTFAQRRMTGSLQAALTGKKIEDFDDA